MYEYNNRIWEWWKLSFSAIIHNLAQFLGWREGITWHSFEPEEEEPFYLQDDHGRRQFKMTMKVDNGEEWLQIRALTPQAASVQNILGECAEYGPQGLARLDQLKAVIGFANRRERDGRERNQAEAEAARLREERDQAEADAARLRDERNTAREERNQAEADAARLREERNAAREERNAAVASQARLTEERDQATADCDAAIKNAKLASRDAKRALDAKTAAEAQLDAFKKAKVVSDALQQAPIKTEPQDSQMAGGYVADLTWAIPEHEIMRKLAEICPTADPRMLQNATVAMGWRMADYNKELRCRCGDNITFIGHEETLKHIGWTLKMKKSEYAEKWKDYIAKLEGLGFAESKGIASLSQRLLVLSLWAVRQALVSPKTTCRKRVETHINFLYGLNGANAQAVLDEAASGDLDPEFKCLYPPCVHGCHNGWQLEGEYLTMVEQMFTQYNIPIPNQALPQAFGFHA